VNPSDCTKKAVPGNSGTAFLFGMVLKAGFLRLNMKSVWGWVRSQLLNLVPEIGSKVNKLRASPFSQNVNISPTSRYPKIAKISYMLWLSQVFENVNIADTLEIFAILIALLIEEKSQAATCHFQI
jgi:hypothetical protein